MTTLLMLLGGLIAMLTIPLLTPGSRESRGRLAGMLVGIYVMLLGFIGAAAAIYMALFGGAAGIKSRTQLATFAFESEPIAAFIAFGVQLLSTSALAAFGWHIFKEARDGTLEP